MSYLLHVRRSGKGPIVVLLHGVAGSGAFWDPMVPLLEQKYEVVRLDLLGYGRSPKPRIGYSVEDHVQAIHNTLIHEGISKPYAVIGLSMGALLWLNYAIAYPGMLGTIIGLGLPYYRNRMEAEELITQDRWAGLAMRHPFWGRFLINIIWWIGRHSPKLRRRIAPSYYSDAMSFESLMNPAYALRPTIINCMLNNLAPILLKQNQNEHILLIHGDQDRWSSVQTIRKAQKAYKNVTLEVLPNVGHNLALEAPAQTAEAILGFLAT